ncbi:MAG: HEAT repeat domain-containing protein [Fimbriimonadaceae bacterium]|nr:HEAT repeat domain-containing protein [Fimbriimonadaceae bacterium]QYK59534.1 MAG: HEAT repeat domain-containing protein [Fimbriimonadaceae bacterium]
MRLWLAAVVSMFGAVGWAQLTVEERRGVDDALFLGNMKPSDLLFERLPFQDKYRFGLVDAALRDPIATLEPLMRLHRVEGGDPFASLRREVLGGAAPMSPAPLATIEGLDALAAPLRTPISALTQAMRHSDAQILEAVKGLTPAEQRELIEGLPVMAVEEPLVVFDFVRSQPSPRKRLLELLSRVDLAKIREAGELVAGVAVRAAQQLRDAKVTMEGKVRLRVHGLPVVVAGNGNDQHDETDVRLIVDLGGDDVYRGRHGAGVGYTGVLIDLAGDDRYATRDLSVGAGVLGVGVAVDLSGDDVYSARNITAGAGIAGFGYLLDAQGNDVYRSWALAQGFGLFGVGVCEDRAGDDHYSVRLFGQGAARTQGVGWLIDHSGSDIYRAGGLSMNEPLFTGVSYSFAQGFASGYREDTGGVSGGIGLLSDLGGNDSYLGDTYCQGASYWLALGSLFDATGNDSYTAHHYAQASAMHVTAAYLIDLEGDDSYMVKVGACHAIGHDYGVALLLDRAGNDCYSSQGGQPGIGVANGLGIFIDSAGNDRYEGPPGQGNAARGTGSLGVFVDLGGTDDYRKGLKDGAATSGSTWGVAYDAESASVALATESRPQPEPGSTPKPSDEQLAALYKTATQWGVGSAQAAVADATDKLIAIGVPALEWMVSQRLAGSDRLQQRCFSAVVKALGSSASPVLARAWIQGSVTERRHLLGIAVDAGATEFAAFVPSALEDPELQLPAAKAAGPLKAVGALPALSRMCLSQDRLLARAAMVSLNQIADPSTLGTAQSMLNSTDLPTWQAAAQLLGKFPDQAVALASTLVMDADDRRARVGVRLLGESKSGEALGRVGALLMDPRPGVRAEALLVLAGRCPQEYIESFLSLRSDPVPQVRALAKSLKPTPD